MHVRAILNFRGVNTRSANCASGCCAATLSAQLPPLFPPQLLQVASGALLNERRVQNYNKKKRPAKLGLIYAEDCSKLQSIAEKVQKKLQQIAAFRQKYSALSVT